MRDRSFLIRFVPQDSSGDGECGKQDLDHARTPRHTVQAW